MSKRQRTAKPPMTSTTVPELLIAVETVCSRAGDVMRATAKVVTGDPLALADDGGPVVFSAALERLADELETLSGRALTARIGSR